MWQGTERRLREYLGIWGWGAPSTWGSMQPPPSLVVPGASALSCRAPPPSPYPPKTPLALMCPTFQLGEASLRSVALPPFPLSHPGCPSQLPLLSVLCGGNTQACWFVSRAGEKAPGRGMLPGHTDHCLVPGCPTPVRLSLCCNSLSLKEVALWLNYPPTASSSTPSGF